MGLLGPQQPIDPFYITIFKRTRMGFHFDTELTQMSDKILTSAVVDSPLANGLSGRHRNADLCASAWERLHLE